MSKWKSIKYDGVNVLIYLQLHFEKLIEHIDHGCLSKLVGAQTEMSDSTDN